MWKVKVSWIPDTPNDCLGFYTSRNNQKIIWVNQATYGGTKQLMETLAHEFMHYINDFTPLELEVRLDALLHRVHRGLYVKAATKTARLFIRRLS